MVNRLHTLLFVLLCLLELDFLPKVKGSSRGEKSRVACENYSKKAKPVLTPLDFKGTNAAVGEYPHVASLAYYMEEKKEYGFFCAGSLISEHYIITAAHCVVNRQGWKAKIARLGVVNVPKNVKTPDPKLDYNVINVTVYKNYSVTNAQNDIALVRVEKVNLTDNVRPACLHVGEDVPNKLVVTGWGAGFDRERSDILQMAAVTPISLQECIKSYELSRKLVTEKHICASHKDGDDTCKSQSGGPLQGYTDSNVWTIVGVTSFGRGCVSSFPTVFVRIDSYLDWIEGIVWS